MTQSFFHQDFLRNIDVELFNQYLASKDLTQIQIVDPKADQLELMVNYVDSVMPAERDKILSDFISIRELASDGGIRAVFELNEDDSFKEKLASQANNICRALYCFAKYPDLFDDALTLKQLESTTNFHTRTRLKKIIASEIEAKQKELEIELSAFLQSEEGRGKNCQIDQYQFKDRVCFIAYPEDHPRSYHFYQDGKLDLKVYHPSFEIIFVYYPDEGKVELSTRMGYKKRQKLFNLFNRAVLDDPNPVPSNQQVLSLDEVLSDDFRLVADPEDQIDSVFISQIRLDYKYNRKKRFIVQLDTGKGVDSMLEELKYRNLLEKSLEHYVVAQVTIKFQFKQFGRSNRVTAVLTTPDRDTLNETASNQLVKKCIQKWGLVNDGDSTTT